MLDATSKHADNERATTAKSGIWYATYFKSRRRCCHYGGLWQEVAGGRLVLVMVGGGRLAKKLDGSWKA